MADGSVKIEVGLNIGKAEKDLAKLKEKINKAENELNSNSARKTELEKQIAQVGAQADEAKKKVIELKDQLNNTRSREEKASIRAQLAEATEEQRILTRESDRLNDEYVKVSSNLEKGKASITEMKEQAGEMARQIEASRPGEAIAKSLDNAKKSLTRFLKYAIGIRSVYILFQRLKGAIKSAVQEYAEYDKELKYNLALMSATRKAIQVTNGAALASAFNAILPIVQKIANWTLEAANAAAKFIAILSGKSSYKRAVVNTAEVAESLEGAEEDTEDTAEAADDVADGFKEVKRQVLGFDELNILDTDTDTDKNAKDSKDKIKEAEKAALDGIDVIDEAIDGLDNSFLDKLALTMKDVLFDWSDLNPEQIAEKFIAGLGALLGAALGIALGMGPGGVLLMTLAGLALGLIADTILFDHDGKLSKTEILNMVLLALNGLVGGVIGFVMSGGSIKGALIGATIGTVLTLAFKHFDMKTEGKFTNLKSGIVTMLTSVLTGWAGLKIGTAVGGTVGGPVGALIGIVVGIGLTLVIEHVKATIAAKDAFYETDFGQQLEDIKNRVQERMKADADIRMHIKSITGEVDERTLADLSAAQKLIDQIFDLDAKKDKTTTEARLLVELVNQLNGMNLNGVSLSFDETTGHIKQTREEVNGLMDDLLRQYQMKAVADAYTESFKAQFEAETALAQAQKDHTEAAGKLSQAVRDNVVAQEKYTEALTDYERASSGFGAYYSEEANVARNRMEAAEQALETTELAVKEATKTTEVTQTALTQATETAEQAKDKVVVIGEAFKRTVEESAEATNTIVQNAGRSSNAYSQSADQITTDSDKMNAAFQSNVNASETAANQVTQNTQQMSEGVSGAYGNVKTNADTTFGKLKDTVTGTTEDIKNETTDDTKQMYSDVTGIYGDIHNDAVTTFDSIDRAVPQIMNGVANQIASSVQDASGSFQQLEQDIQTVISNIQGLDWSIPAPHIPHISWTYDTVYSDDGSSFNIPQFFVDWYARGGVFDYPQLIGVGENGAEAVVPLEKNTGWMKLVADGLMERFERADFANRLAEAFMNTPRPAMAGGVVPPRAIGGNSMFTDSDIDRIVRGLSGLFIGSGNQREIVNKIYLDGKQLADSVSKWQRMNDRARG